MPGHQRTLAHQPLADADQLRISAGCHRPSTRTSAADWTLSIPEACNRRELVDQNEMSALWTTPRSRARGSSGTPTVSNVTDWISQVEAAELLGVTPTSVYRMVTRGDLHPRPHGEGESWPDCWP